MKKLVAAPAADIGLSATRNVDPGLLNSAYNKPMRLPSTLPERIAIGIHPTLPEAAIEAQRLSSFLSDLGIKNHFSASLNDEKFRRRVSEGEADLLIALGGDGTMLRAGHLCSPIGIPILGINLGHFGFLSELERTEWREKLPQLFKGNYHLEDRMMLCVDHCRDDETLHSYHVLNEVVVCRGKSVRPIRTSAYIDEYLLASYVSDGLIASTPTGSTAYALAVGGPIMPPELRNILIIPIAPHLSLDRAIILAEGVRVTITVNTTHEAVFSIDGHSPVDVKDGDSVCVGSCDLFATFVRFQDAGYFYRSLSRYTEQNPSAGA
jgi:NAD+ kinase